MHKARSRSFIYLHQPIRQMAGAMRIGVISASAALISWIIWLGAVASSRLAVSIAASASRDGKGQRRTSFA